MNNRREKKPACPGCGQPIRIPSANGAGEPSPATAVRAPAAASAGLKSGITAAKKAGAARPPVAKGNATESVAAPSRSVSDSKTATSESGKTSAETYDFLAPPKGPDELGWLGPYRVLKVLGSGAMGVVFQAEDPHLQRQVALKAMLPAMAASESARKRFLREAQPAAALEHDHIVSIYQVGEDRGIPFMAMQFLKGEPLDERLKREKCLPVQETLRIGREVAEGLDAAHQRGLIHRDIKPANLWLEPPRTTS